MKRVSRAGPAAAVLLSLAVICALFAPTSAFSKARKAAGAESLQALLAGNERFVEGRAQHPRQDAGRVRDVAEAQHPAAIIVSCSDSRVPPEILFDQGIGDLFVVRVAGNVLDDMALGSVEYGAEVLKAPLVVVLGHSHCGAVKAAVKGGEVPGHIEEIVKAIAPAVEQARKCCPRSDLVETAAHLNVEAAVKALSTTDPILARLAGQGKLSVVGAFYDLDTGKVELLPAR